METMRNLFGENETILSCFLDQQLQSVVCNESTYRHQKEHWTPANKIFWICLISYIALVIICGLMQGLVLAVATLDLTVLKVMREAGTEEAKKYVKKLMPLAKKHHLIMVSLIVANCIAAEAMPVLLDRISNPIIAVVVSATAFLIFGEILPQAICSKHALPIGYYSSYLIWALTGIFYIISYPLSLLLDWMLGKDHGTLYKRTELSALVDMHGPALQSAGEESAPVTCGPRRKSQIVDLERLSADEVHVIKGALAMSEKCAWQVMVKLEDVYMLPSDAILDESLINEIFHVGHSRIPVYHGNNRSNVIGVFLTKRLILINPKESRSIGDIFCGPDAERSWYQPYLVDENEPLYDLLNEFQTGTSHMALVTRNTNEQDDEVIGIVTLEDLIEELLQEEITDESDIQRHWRLQTAKVKAVQRLTREKDNKCPGRNQPMIRHLSVPCALGKDNHAEGNGNLEKQSSMSFIA